MTARGSHISLFAGIGGIDIAAETIGFRTAVTAESDPWCRSVLRAGVYDRAVPIGERSAGSHPGPR